MFQNNALLKTIAVAKPILDGQITLHLIPFVTLRHDLLIAEFGRIVPPSRYVHERTGETVTAEPSDLKLAREAARLTQTDVMSDWREVSQWTYAHNTFVSMSSALVDVTFALTPESPLPLKAFELYWTHRPDDLKADWELFAATVGAAVYNAYWAAWSDAQHSPAKAPQEPPKEATDPEALSGAGATAITDPPSTST